MPEQTPCENWPELLDVNDVARCTGMTLKDARRIFNAPDFPLLIPGKRADRLVNKVKLLRYLRGEQ